MSYEIMIPDAAELPAHIINTELARQANEAAAAGISTGFPARIKMSGKQFVLVDGNGDEKPIPMGKLFKGPDDNLYLRTVVLAAKPELQKRWYATKFDPSKEGQAPDCFSNDGVTPDASIPTPQCASCVNCPHNAFGSAVGADGKAGNGKACTDNKIIATFIPPLAKGEASPGVHELKITPASLKNWALYVKALTNKGIPVGNVFTLVRFVDEATFPVMTFQYGGALPEASVNQLAALAQEQETQDIVTQRMTYTAKGGDAPSNTAAPQTTKPEQPAQPAADDLGLGEPAQAASAAPADDLGLGTQAAQPEPEAQEQPAAPEISDAELAASLGL